jgi:hypothetical protein
MSQSRNARVGSSTPSTLRPDISATPQMNTSDINQTMEGMPSLPRGQMPIEEVFKMMWARMNYLENSMKDSSSSVSGEETHNHEGATTIQQLRENQLITTPPSYDTTAYDEHETKIDTLAKEIGALKKSLADTVSNFNSSIQVIGADLTEMNTKYTQMNNFLMEIQTTQITVNNQILKHYNENYSEVVESQIEKSAVEKFNMSTTPPSDTADEIATKATVGSDTTSNTASNTETAVVETESKSVVEAIVEAAEAAEATDTTKTADVNTSNTNEASANDDGSVPEPKKNNVTFNIE